MQWCVQKSINLYEKLSASVVADGSGGGSRSWGAGARGARGPPLRDGSLRYSPAVAPLLLRRTELSVTCLSL